MNEAVKKKIYQPSSILSYQENQMCGTRSLGFIKKIEARQQKKYQLCPTLQ